MHRNTYTHSSSSSGPPPPPPPPYGYERYDQPPPPAYPPPPGGSSRPWNDHYSQQDHRDSYQFRGPYSDLRRDRPSRPDDHRRSDGGYRDNDRNDRNSYRPPQSDFTFRAALPPGVESLDSYRPREREQRASRMRGDDRNTSHNPRRNENHDDRPRRNDDRRRQQNSQRRGRPGQPPYGRPKPAARLLLRKKHDEQPELMLGDAAARVTYRDVDELSDSDEAAMDISDNSDSDVAEPASKRARTSAETTIKADQDVPKWSNPDPYTALPPPDESTRKKKDMVQLIRKARVEAEAKKPAAQEEGLDFISCDFDDDNEPDDSAITARAQLPPTDYAATVPRAPDGGAASTAMPSTSLSLQSMQTARTDKRSPSNSTTLQGNRNSIDLTASTSLGSRKRTIDDKIKQPQKISASTNKGVKMQASGHILPSWRPLNHEDSCPWITADYSDTPSLATRLHKELVDFYDWVSPREFEKRIRGEMVEKLRKIIKRRWPDADLYLFGSFTSELYLPTADMDIAFCSNSFINRGVPRYDRKKDLWIFKQHLIANNVSMDYDIEVISKAKVPLVKYTDVKSRLKVDISFEKIDGHRAIQTFLNWKAQYPVLPKLVAVIKQFLLMRGLNEPVNGGIGGFSVICMVVHLLNQMPEVQSRSMIPQHHLGELLMEFFDYYGNHFSYNTVAIRMSPPGLVPKNEVSTFVYRNMDRLSILDPNNPENDIAGGSSNTATIVRRFADAYNTLRERFVHVGSGGGNDFGGTLLGPLFGGNYSSFQKQRSILQSLYEEGFGEYGN